MATHHSHWVGSSRIKPLSIGLLYLLSLTTNTQTLIGQQNCVGKGLAFLELRTIISLLILKFSVAFAPGDDGSSVTEALTDHFASTPGKLKLVFTPV
jgi:hypothetical protein